MSTNHRSRLQGLSLLLLAVFILSGCTVRVSAPDPSVASPTPFPGDVPPGEHTIRLHVVEGPSGGVLAFVPVFIDDQGPFPFALDTGASKSVVDRELVDRLQLQVVGASREVTGVSGSAQASEVQVEQWRMGPVPLPSGTAVTLDLPDPEGRTGLQGLLGSDLLSGFQVITVDYEKQELRFSVRE